MERNDPSVQNRRGGDNSIYCRFSWLILFVIIVVNVVMFLVTMAINNCPENSSPCLAGFLGRFSFQPFEDNPTLGPTTSTLERMGGLDVNKLVKGHQGWRLFSCIWLNAGILHLLINMLSLWYNGIQLKHDFGFVRIGLIYIISGLGGSMLSALFLQNDISVGASGAIFGLMGAVLSKFIINWKINKFALIHVLNILLNFLEGMLPHVDNFAHIGGFAYGFLLGFVLIRPQFGRVMSLPPGYPITSARPKYKAYQYALCASSLILLIVGFIVGLVMVFRGVNGNDYCSWCHYLSCVPTKWSCNSKSVPYCQSTQFDNELSLTCDGTSRTYPFRHATDSQISQLCSELGCSS